jgi:hypothetical protein
MSDKLQFVVSMINVSLNTSELFAISNDKLKFIGHFICPLPNLYLIAIQFSAWHLLD